MQRPRAPTLWTTVPWGQGVWVARGQVGYYLASHLRTGSGRGFGGACGTSDAFEQGQGEGLGEPAIPGPSPSVGDEVLCIPR